MKSHFDNDKVSDILNAYESFENRKARKKLAEKLKREKEIRIIWASASIILVVIFFVFFVYGLFETASTQQSKQIKSRSLSGYNLRHILYILS